MQTRYSVSELRRLVKESANEFQPKMGVNVTKDNKKINDEAYAEASKRVKNFDGGVRTKSKKQPQYPQSDNRGMQDLRYDNINQTFKDNVKSQMRGYTSANAEKLHKNDDFGNAEYNDIQGMDERAKDFKKKKDVAAEIGLTTRELDKKDLEKLSSTVFEGNMSSTYRIRLRNTQFLNEEHMLSKIPDEYRINGLKLVMEDKNKHTYMVEWYDGKERNPYVVDKTTVNENMERMKHLYSYKTQTTETTNAIRLTEDSNLNNMVSRMRELMR